MKRGVRFPKRCFFIIVFEGRTGSSYAVSCLNSHPDIFCYPEILAHHSAIEQQDILTRLADGEKIEKSAQVNLNPMYFHGGMKQAGVLQAVGFKAKLQDIWRVSDFYDYLYRYRFRLIYLKRRNIIKSALSMLNAHHLVREYGDGHWNASRKGQVQGAFYVPPDDLLTQLQERIHLEKWHQRFFDLYEEDKIQLSYEDMLQDEGHFMSRMLGFLQVQQNTLRGRFLKNTPNRLQDAILNYDEIQRLFLNTYFERFFDDDLGC